MFNHSFLKYFFFQVILYFSELVIFYSLYFAFDNLYIANSIARFFIAILGYFVHSKFTFNHKVNFLSALKFLILIFLISQVSSILLLIIIELVHNIYLSKLLSDIIIFIAFYFINKKFVFN